MYLESYDKNTRRVGVLVDAYDISRRRRLNSDYELSFLLPMTSDDFREKLILKGHVKDERGQYYVINSRQRVRDGKKLTAAITCSHVMFKLADYKIPYASYIGEAYGVHISRLLDTISATTNGKFTFSIDDTFDLFDVKDWGRGNALQALNDVITMYNCELDPNNFRIHVRKKIGTDDGYQCRIGKNVISTNFKDEVGSLVTRMFVQMKDGRTWIGQPASILTAEEHALLSQVPGAIIDGKLAVNYLISPYQAHWASDSIAYFDGEITEQDIEDPIKLLEAARKALVEKEVPALELSVSAADLYKLDKTEPKPNLGDTVRCIDPELGIDSIIARITELTEYPYDNAKHSQVTVANVMLRDYTDIIADLERSKNIVDNIFSGGRIRTDVFEAFAKQAVHDVNNSKTEIQYPATGGIRLVEKTNPLEQVRLESRGIMLTTDGGHNARTAITARGIVAELVVGQLGNFASMLIGNGNEVTQINTRGIAAGHADFNSAPARIDMQGNAVFNRLTANSAQIKSSNFTDGDIIGSSINVGNGVFTVDRAGNMVATSGNFRGSISASSFMGGTITGSLIRTAASGPRVEMDAGGWRTFDSNNRERIAIHTSASQNMSAINFRGSAGGSIGYINGGDGAFELTSYVDMLIAAIGRRLNIQGLVDFSGASGVLGLNSSHISDLQSLLNIKVTKGEPTSSVTGGAHNHGFPDGTSFKDINGQVHVYRTYGGFTHSHVV
ncbi:phage tail protein [Paenibacillus sp. SC116]|uniref:phage tail protein n=1 Tax=Paenibacillus sp. SC116 TaxID=2968986 RepID=UPI00215A0D95|nr:phage tail protein [Paenibacillus sp. SC116]MCR8843069.1 phage tail protein [Paenibacillus sp. SC116]